MTSNADSGSRLTHRLYKLTRSIWLAQLKHPFVEALGEGTLPQARFAYYIRQDALFLGEFAKMFAHAMARTENPDEMRKFSKLLLNTLQGERAMHESYAETLGITPDPMAPTTYAYTRHLLHIGATGSLAEVVTAILPCMWIYAEIGRHFQAQGPPHENHEYRDWLLTYASPEFQEDARWLQGVLDTHASGLDESRRRSLEQIFLTSSRYEWMFWEMAWREERWPV